MRSGRQQQQKSGGKGGCVGGGRGGCIGEAVTGRGLGWWGGGGGGGEEVSWGVRMVGVCCAHHPAP